ncbi:MAG TPA: type II toxin-antitoxin system VapC family toxin [Fimbriiglobus sp.]|nr:type II toxin-antitoxin system VapC family toxin [Fimbriiglobus sp.]
MILLDTHIWFWWVRADPNLTASQLQHIQGSQAAIGVSVYSVWELAMLEQSGRVNVFRPIEDWVRDALAYPGVRLLDLTPEIAIASTRLPTPFHKDPADRILVATARALAIPILTADAKILAYPHVQTLT